MRHGGRPNKLGWERRGKGLEGWGTRALESRVSSVVLYEYRVVPNWHTPDSNIWKQSYIICQILSTNICDINKKVHVKAYDVESCNSNIQNCHIILRV